MRRIALLGGAAPLGLLTGLVAWVLAGGLSVKANALDTVESGLSALKPPAALASQAGRGEAAALLGSPLFALTTGPGAVREPSIRVDGVSLSRRRTAALVSIDGKPSEWLEIGESRDGVTLQEVSSSSVTFETAVGTKALNLGDQSAASAPAPIAAAGGDQPPPGFRAPPEPASAPRGP